MWLCSRGLPWTKYEEFLWGLLLDLNNNLIIFVTSEPVWTALRFGWARKYRTVTKTSLYLFYLIYNISSLITLNTDKISSIDEITPILTHLYMNGHATFLLLSMFQNMRQFSLFFPSLLSFLWLYFPPHFRSTMIQHSKVNSLEGFKMKSLEMEKNHMKTFIGYALRYGPSSSFDSSYQELLCR